MSATPEGRSPGSLRGGRLASAAVIMGISATLLALTQWWSGLDTPDSEFYLSLSIFTHEVTDRAPVDSYFWTRLGYIAPTHLLTSLLGVWVGFAAWKALLLVTIIGSTFVLVRRHASLVVAAWLTAAVGSSSVVLAYLGNSYITAPVMAGTALLTALGTRPTLISGAFSGGVLGWLAMSYPGGALLGGSLWIALVIHSWHDAKVRIPDRLRQFIVTVAATGITLALFLGAGAALFPGLNWLATYIEATGFDYGIYSSGEWVWLRDISLLVPLAVLVIAFANWATRRMSRPAQQALIVSLTSISFILVYSPLFGAHFLEAPPSQAMLWPPAMMAIALVGASRMPAAEAWSPWHVGIAFLGLCLIVAAGYVDPDFTFIGGLVIVIILIALVIACPRVTLAALISITAFLGGSQLLQNSREPLGQFKLSPYYWAFRDNPVEEKVRVAVNAQTWVLANTTSDDQIMQWVEGPWIMGDRELYTVAAMQLWGPNLLTLEPVLDKVYGLPNLERFRPSVIEMSGKSMNSVMTFWKSLPSKLNATPPKCYDYAWPIDPRSDYPTPIGHTCLTRLTW